MEHRSKSRELPEGMFVADDEELPAVGIDRHRIDDEVYQHVPDNPAEWAEYHMAEDGMPKPKVPTAMPYAPPLHPDNLCCIADTRSFCIRGKWGDVLATFEPDEVSRALDGRYRVKRELAASKLSPRARDLVGATPPQGIRDPDSWLVDELLCFHTQRSYGQGYGWLEVEPIRPQCKHFARQMSDFQDLADHAFVARLCTARRDSGGEPLTLRDSQMFACDMRDPPDLKGIERADKFDENKILLGLERIKKGEMWDVDKALREAVDETGSDDPAATGGGIFREG